MSRSSQPSLEERLAAVKARLWPSLHLDEGNRSRKRRIEATSSRKAPRRGDASFPELQSRRDFHASDCVERLSKELGVRSETEGFSGTLVLSYKTDVTEADAVWKEMKNALDFSWSDVALRQGVDLSKSGKYAEAIDCYQQALKLNGRSADAYVARGAAFANQGFYDKALKDFDRALGLNPTDKNALEYKNRILRRKLEREGRIKPASQPQKSQLQYRQGLLGKGLPLAAEKRGPDQEDVKAALDVIKRHRERRRRHRK